MAPTNPTDAALPRRLFYRNGGFATQKRLRRILSLAGHELCLTGAPQPGDGVVVWGRSPTAHRGEALAQRHSLPLVRVEDAFLRSLRPGRAGDAPIGLLIDPNGVHFDPVQPSRIERLLATHPLDDSNLLQRARDGMARLIASDLSKYNIHDPCLPPPAPGYVLVVDQTRNDASLTASGADASTFAAMLAALLVAVGAVWLERRDSSTLAAAALAGYAAGALWLVPVARAQDTDAASAVAPGAGDPRSERLKFIHTLSDVLVSTALAAHWSLVYGAAQAGCLLILLRVMGFVPALVSSAWAQVVMSRPEAQRPSSWLAALTGAGCVAVAALMVRLALHAGWLAPSWSSLGLYVWPLALWQAAACLIAAASHRPFRHGRARAYTLQCIAMNGVQALLLVLPPWLGWGQQSHLWALAGFLCIALSLQALWSARLPSST